MTLAGAHRGGASIDHLPWGVSVGTFDDARRLPSKGSPAEAPAPGSGDTLAEGMRRPALADRVRAALTPHRSQTELISSLNDVASAVSSKLAVEEVLETVVERAKRVTNTDKAVLCLVDEGCVGHRLDIDTMVVRGSREEHPESWWGGVLDRIGVVVFGTGESHLELSRENKAWLLCAPIKVKDRPIGLLAAINSQDHRFSSEQVDFLAILGAFAAAAIENARLAEQTRYVLLASERDRIAREMHDGISQSLFSISLGLELCKKQVSRDPAGVSRRLEELQGQLGISMAELRRFIYDLRPLKLQELGLSGAIDAWIHTLTAGDRVDGRLVVTGEKRALSPGAEACLYRVAKESVSNVVKHAEARGFEVRLNFHEETVELEVEDDGKGFDPGRAMERAEHGHSLGIKSIRERVTGEGGTFEIRSGDVGGALVRVTLPA